MGTIVNKVAESGIVTIDLSDYLPTADTIKVFDLKPFLFREMILKEKDYRTALQEYNWQEFSGKEVAVVCSVDAIIPVWAYMLAASYLQPFASAIFFGTLEQLTKEKLLKNIRAIDPSEFTDKRVVIKGCGEMPIPEAAYLSVTTLLRPHVKSLMYGEPCSTVPIFKKK